MQDVKIIDEKSSMDLATNHSAQMRCAEWFFQRKREYYQIFKRS